MPSAPTTVLLTSEAAQLLEQLKEFDPRRLTEEVISLGEDWAIKNANANDLEESKKSILARYALEYIEGHSKLTASLAGEKPKPMSMAQAELKALADPRYESHLNMMVHARKESDIARVRYDLARVRLELMRSVQATMRTEMKLGNF